jgi:hypothetical protein
LAALSCKSRTLRSFTFTLLSDGSSDRALLSILRWLLREHSQKDFQSQWADLRGQRRPPKSLSDRIHAALTLYPCDLLFVHRDAEKADRETRVAEIRKHLLVVPGQTAICVVPVRMQEAWFLFNEAAIRLAADNPRGRTPLSLPSLDHLEALADPKGVLCDLLIAASGLCTGRLHRFMPGARIHRLSELIEDFSPLRQLGAFRALEEDVKDILARRSWS